MLTRRRRVAEAAFASLALPFLITTSRALGAGSPPTFAHDIAPIIYQHCSACHHPGEIGPFPLLTYSDVKKHAHQIVAVTGRRYMPPWLPEPGYGDFQGERRLTDKQIQLIADWVRAGSPEGPPTDLAAAPSFAEGWRLGHPDMIVNAGSPLTVPASGPDLFWNFTFRPDLKVIRYVRAIEIRPNGKSGNPRIVHHANMLVDRTGSAERLEKAPGGGFPGMELTLDRNPLDPPGHFLFWKPGSPPYSEPAGFSWPLAPGNELVLNTHLQPSGKPETIQPSIGLYFTDTAPTRFPLLIELENDDALRIPAGRRDFLVSDGFRLPLDVDVLGIYPHAHYLGKRLEAYATLPGGKRVWLIRIPDWDLNWQAVYYYRQPVFLPKGSVVSMRYHYDNSAENPRNPNSPPKLVEAGDRATDEMGHLWLQILPCGRGDRRRGVEQALLLHRLERDPGDASAHRNLGALLLSRLQTQSAIDELRKSIALDPRQPEAHDMLGSALRSVGRSSEAITEYRTALALDPHYVESRYNLATALAKAGKWNEAIVDFRQVVGGFPNSARLRNELGEVLARGGELDQALTEFEKAVALDPGDQAARGNREWTLRKIAERTQKPSK